MIAYQMAQSEADGAGLSQDPGDRSVPPAGNEQPGVDPRRGPRTHEGGERACRQGARAVSDGSEPPQHPRYDLLPPEAPGLGRGATGEVHPVHGGHAGYEGPHSPPAREDPCGAGRPGRSPQEFQRGDRNRSHARGPANGGTALNSKSCWERLRRETRHNAACWTPEAPLLSGRFKTLGLFVEDERRMRDQHRSQVARR